MAFSYHDPIVDEALTVSGGFEVRVLFSTGDLDVPHPSPSPVQLLVNWVDS